MPKKPPSAKPAPPDIIDFPMQDSAMAWTYTELRVSKKSNTPPYYLDILLQGGGEGLLHTALTPGSWTFPANMEETAGFGWPGVGKLMMCERGRPVEDAKETGRRYREGGPWIGYCAGWIGSQIFWRRDISAASHRLEERLCHTAGRGGSGLVRLGVSRSRWMHSASLLVCRSARGGLPR